MKKSLGFILIATIVFWLFCLDTIQTTIKAHKIQQSQQEAFAHLIKVTQHLDHQSRLERIEGTPPTSTYYLHYGFDVNGKHYTYTSLPTGKTAAERAMKNRVEKVAYLNSNPNVNIAMQQDAYTQEWRLNVDPFDRILTVSLVIVLMITIPVWLLAFYLVPWSKRVMSQANAKANSHNRYKNRR